MKVWIAIAASLCAVVGVDAAEPDSPKPVSIDAATRARLGIVVAPVEARTQVASVTGFARVLDPIPLAQLDSDIAAAAPVARASAVEAARSRALFAADATVSRRVAETASSQARGDAARLALLRRRLALEWGPAIARLNDASRASLVTALAAGRAAIVRIDTAGGVGQLERRSVSIDLGSLGIVTAMIMGPARSADPRLQSPGLLARVTGRKASLLSTGLTAPARIGGAARTGVVVPATAVLRLNAATWVYVQNAGESFQRRRLVAVSAVPGGLFANGGLHPGDRIAIRGASALHAAELGGGPAAD